MFSDFQGLKGRTVDAEAFVFNLQFIKLRISLEVLCRKKPVFILQTEVELCILLYIYLLLMLF